MSKKKILAIILITILAIIGVVGAIGYSFKDSDVTIGQQTIINNITNEGTELSPSFSGFVTVEQEVYIYNSGMLDIEDIEVLVTVYFTGERDTSEVEIGSKLNNLGTAPAGENVSKIIEVDFNNKIARLAVEDGTFRIVIDTTLQIQFIPYTIEVPQQQTTEPWDAPYSDLGPPANL